MKEMATKNYHCVQLDGFDGVKGEQTVQKVKNLLIIYKVEGDWRKTDLAKIRHTILIRKWTFKNEEFTEKSIAPWGMKKFISDLLCAPKCYASFDVIPTKVRLALDIPDLAAKFSDDKKQIAQEYNSEIKQHIKITAADQSKKSVKQ